MKLELNIGLSSKVIGILNPFAVLNALTGAGFELLTYRVIPSTCEDGNEDCLAVRVNTPDDWQTQLNALAARWGQDCIAFTGFAGATPYEAFDATCWKSPDAKPELEAASVRGYSYTRPEFCNYLRNTLIPDFEASGMDSTAEDFRIALEFLEAKQ